MHSSKLSGEPMRLNVPGRSSALRCPMVRHSQTSKPHSGRDVLRHLIHIHGNRADRAPFPMDESPDFLGRGTGEGRLSTTLANLRRNVLDKYTAAIDREHLAHEFIS